MLFHVEDIIKDNIGPAARAQLKSLIGPLADVANFIVHPIVPLEALAKLFQEMAE